MTLHCARCGATAQGKIADLVDEAYLVDDPARATGALCPQCAADDDPHHIQASWLLSWSEGLV